MSNRQLKFHHLMIVLVLLLFGGLLAVRWLPQLYAVLPEPVYLTIHTILEFFSVAVSTAVFIVAWYNFRQTNNRRELVVCLTFIAVAMIDFAHAMSYNGMPVFFTANSVNKASIFWVLGRITQAAGLMITALTKPDEADKADRSDGSDRSANPLGYVFLTIAVVLVTIWFITVNLPNLPPMFIDGFGQTRLKIFLDYLAIIIQSLALLYIMLGAKAHNADRHIEAALLFGICSELAFTLYDSAYDTFNLIGHIYKIGAFICLLRGFFVASVVRLYESNKVLVEKRRRLSEINVQLEKVNQLKTDFLANTNHELRTPLTAIIAFTELLLDEQTGPLNPVQKDYLQEINDSSHQLLMEINNLLDLTKIEAGEMKIHLESTSMGNLIAQVVKQLTPLLYQKRQSIMVSVPDNLPEIPVDRDKVKKIITNLLSNAIKFSPVQSSIYLDAKVSEDRQSVVVAIKDTGMGLRNEQLNSLFGRFSQITDSRTKASPGTGLGLAIVKCLVELHKGRVWVESEVGQGSTFSFSLPVNLPEKEAILWKTREF